MATKKKPSPMDLIVAALKRNKNIAYADVKAAADKKKLVIHPIMYGRAKLLLGLVKPGKKKVAKKAAKRGPGRPKGSKNKRGPGRPKKTAGRRPGRPKKAARRGRPRKVVSAVDALQGLMTTLRDQERQNAQLRNTIGKIGDLIARI